MGFMIYTGSIFRNSIDVIENPYITEKRVRKIKVKRSILERLFSLTWRPFAKEKEVEQTYEVPSDKYYLMKEHGKTVICVHPAMKEKLLKIIQENGINQ